MIILTEIISKKVKLGYIDTDSLIIRIKTKDSYKEVVRDVEKKRFDTSNYKVKRSLLIEKNKSHILNER